MNASSNVPAKRKFGKKFEIRIQSSERARIRREFAVKSPRHEIA
jgi:hypothetical protein